MATSCIFVRGVGITNVQQDAVKKRGYTADAFIPLPDNEDVAAILHFYTSQGSAPPEDRIYMICAHVAVLKDGDGDTINLYGNGDMQLLPQGCHFIGLFCTAGRASPSPDTLNQEHQFDMNIAQFTGDAEHPVRMRSLVMVDGDRLHMDVVDITIVKQMEFGTAKPSVSATSSSSTSSKPTFNWSSKGKGKRPAEEPVASMSKQSKDYCTTIGDVESTGSVHCDDAGVKLMNNVKQSEIIVKGVEMYGDVELTPQTTKPLLTQIMNNHVKVATKLSTRHMLCSGGQNSPQILLSHYLLLSGTDIAPTATHYYCLQKSTPFAFLYDEKERERNAAAFGVEATIIQGVRDALREVNPYVSKLHHFRRQNNPRACHLELQDVTSNGDFTAILHTSNSTKIQPRSIVIHKHSSHRPEFINILSRHYKPLHYVLFFPHGEPGWGTSPLANGPNLSLKLNGIVRVFMMPTTIDLPPLEGCVANI
ncbi:hypothetical protein JAAARDRAFT_49302 [Jaapia argillacea MUCL 33604]|uniref:Uncharacterized protein n=1 Tax=Jaapia argillacea MUCL 33604 TaxID=933084 RepID=A0A067PSI4_9AGAM|nr:hypothetical protein JAAARDRAFT_49302 [Jaapia argillacea MUCL 33604]